MPWRRWAIARGLRIFKLLVRAGREGTEHRHACSSMLGIPATTLASSSRARLRRPGSIESGPSRSRSHLHGQLQGRSAMCSLTLEKECCAGVAFDEEEQKRPENFLLGYI